MRTRQLRTREGGWTTVELAASIAVLVLGLISLAVGFHGTAILTQKTRENNLLGQAYRNMVAELKVGQFNAVSNDFAVGSGRENFWLGDNNTDPVPEQKVFYSAPLKELLTGNVHFYDETSIPGTWSGFPGGIDINADGLIGSVLPVLALPSTKPYKVLPTRITINLNGLDGMRTLNAEFLLNQ